MVNITNDMGNISITSEVFMNLAGDAATSCFGVKGMAGRSKEGGPLQLLRRESMSKGVGVSFNDDGSIYIISQVKSTSGGDILQRNYPMIVSIYTSTLLTGTPVDLESL